MPRQRRKGRVYLKSGRYYGDFRDLGGKLEALKPSGEKRATQDADVAAKLAAERVTVLEPIRRGISLVGIGQVEGLGKYGQHHLERKAALGEATDWSLGGIQLQLERACEFFGTNKPLTAITVADVQKWAEWLRERFTGRRGRAALSDGAVRHHLNALSNLYKRAIDEHKLPLGCNPRQRLGSEAEGPTRGGAVARSARGGAAARSVQDVRAVGSRRRLRGAG